LRIAARPSITWNAPMVTSMIAANVMPLSAQLETFCGCVGSL
jgi:hypothetical protein